MPEYTEVTSKNVYKAYDNWCEIMGMNSYHPFWKFLKTDPMDAISTTWTGSFKVNNDGLKRLGMLLSDNWKAYISVHKTRIKK